MRIKDVLKALNGVSIPMPETMALALARSANIEKTNRYPEWFSKHRCKGQRSRSLKMRSNRRKAAKR